MYCPDNLAPYCPDYTYGAGTTKMRLQCTDGYYVLKNCASNVATNFEYPASVNELLINEPMATLEPTINCYKCSFLVRQENEEAELPAGLQMNSTTASRFSPIFHLHLHFIKSIFINNRFMSIRITYP